ncbi:LysR family transcriptional regulator [Paraburkholderia nemoris]|uniref:LysR family transcriptional regulator n=1 Tax=Paraburkholderia nemoris TaxID=2793076 RepID=UPI0038BAB3BD
MDDFRQLRIFAAIVETGGLSAAAHRLDVANSVVSRALSLLEGRLGIRLATRTTRSLELTEEGQIYYERVQAILLALKDAEEEVTQNTRAPIGTLRVGVPSEIGRKRIAPLIARFVRQHPKVDIRLVLSDDGLDVIQDNLDVAIRIDLPTDVAVVARKLMSSERIVCASPAYIAQFGMPEAPVDLAAHACIRLIRGQRLMDRWTFAENGTRREVQISGALATDNGEVMHDWALEGHGIGLKARWDVEEDLLKGTLIECLGDYQCDSIDLYAVYASRRHLSLRIRRFIDFLVDEFQPASQPSSVAI